MHNVNVLIKPASGMCNLRCKYCFYCDEAKNREVESYGFMSEETLETVIRKALDYSDVSCSFTFQGGEPFLRGLPFLKSSRIAEKTQYEKCKDFQRDSDKWNAFG